jgi:DNA-binding HxlR family transcriptional regulator
MRPAAEAVLVCKACGEAVKVRDIELSPGPGAGLEPAPRARHSRRASRDVGGQACADAGALDRGAGRPLDRPRAGGGLLRPATVQRLPGELKVASNILTDRLGGWLSAGMLERVRYQARPERWEYRLTTEGRDLFPLVVALMAWGDRWLTGSEGSPEMLTHSCGAVLEPVVRCGVWRGVDVGNRQIDAPLPGALSRSD